MSKPRKTPTGSTMLDLWRPPQSAGEPIGCLATTYTFAPGMFDEQCLARFLEIGSEPSRESLPFLLERESRLGGIYAGVLVDHTRAGVEHSFRWDVLSVRIPSSKQHAKLSLLAWSRHVRIIVASANLTEPGYRSNHEIAVAVDLRPNEANAELLAGSTTFLRSLIDFVPGTSARLPEVRRARKFLDDVENYTRKWKPVGRAGSIRQQVVFTLPSVRNVQPARSSLKETIQACRRRGASPTMAWVASPFFDANEETSHAAASLCKLMARGKQRDLCFCVPAIRDNASSVPRLAAPKSLLTTTLKHHGSVTVKMLPDIDADKNRRQWHAKMLGVAAEEYSALMIGSSNFTTAGLGLGTYPNAEANLLTIVDHVAHSRNVGQINDVWPKMADVTDPQSAEWLGATRDNEEEEQEGEVPAPPGFLSSTYHAGKEARLILRFNPAHLPQDWHIYACGQQERDVLSAPAWQKRGRPKAVELAWPHVEPPEKLLVRWGDLEAFLPINVENTAHLPPPVQLEGMSADDMLLILAATDPSAAFRVWAKAQQPSDWFDSELDSATPIDLDPLRRFDLQTTFLHRIRRRARILAQLRANLERPVLGRQSLEWRLWGLVGITPLADRLVREVANANGRSDEALLTLADFLIVLREINYQPIDGALSKAAFNTIYSAYLKELANSIDAKIQEHSNNISIDAMNFWERVLEQCRG